MKYKIDFKLNNPVNDLDEARLYLREAEEDCKLNIRKDISSICEDLIDISWLLSSNEEGYITIELSREITPEEKVKISEWFIGQIYDGVGEGFIEQDFCYYKDDWNTNSSDDWEEDNEDYIQVNFSKENTYELIAVVD